MSTAGVHSNRGDDYQVAVATYWAIRLLIDSSIESLEIDAVTLPGQTQLVSIDDIVVCYVGGALRFIQAKKNQANFRLWSIADLKKELIKAAKQWHDTPNGVIEFYSRTPFGLLQKTCDQVSIYDHDSFFIHAKAELKRALKQVAELAKITTQNAHTMLLQFQFGSAHSFEDWNQQHRTLLDRRVTDIDIALDVIDRVVCNSQSKQGVRGAFDRALLIRELDTRGVSCVGSTLASLAEANHGVASSIGYAPAKDVRANKLVIADQTKLLLVTGESGTGKSWTLCRFGLAHDESMTKILLRDADPSAVIQAIERVTSTQVEVNRIVIVVDGLVDAAHVERVWQCVAKYPVAHLVVAVSMEVAGRLKDQRVGGNSLDEHRETRFTTANVLDYLTRHKVEHAQIPADVLKLLKLPLLANVYVKVSGAKQFSGAMEYQLFDAFWNEAICDQPERVGVLLQLASAGETSFTASAAALVQCGWLLKYGETFEFAHDRLRQWALAKYATEKVSNDSIADWMNSHTEANGYLLMDWLWMNLPLKTDVAFALISEKAKADPHPGFSKLLSTLGGVVVPLFIKLVADCNEEAPREFKWCEAISEVLNHEVLQRREQLIGATLRQWLRSSNENLLLRAARILGKSFVPEAFSALWQQGIKNYDDQPLDYALNCAVSFQVAESPALLLACQTSNQEQINDVCWHISDLPSNTAKEIWSKFKLKVTRIDLINSGNGVLKCVRKFRDLSFLTDVRALCDETRSDLDAEVKQSALVAWVNLDPEAALPRLMKDIDASIGYRKQWVFDAHRIAADAVETSVLDHMDNSLNLSCSLIEEFGGPMSAQMFQAFVAALSKNLSELTPEQLPYLGNLKYFYACKSLDAWSSLRGSEAEARLTDHLIARPFCGHTTNYCLSALAAINGEGIQRVLGNAELLKQCSRAGAMLATSGKAVIPSVNARDNLGYALGVIESEGLARFIDRYLDEMPRALPLDLFDIFEPLAASDRAYTWAASVLARAAEVNLDNLFKARAVLALAPNPELNAVLESSMLVHRDDEKRWVLFKALERADLSTQTIVDQALEFVRLKDLHAVNFVLAIGSLENKRQLADLIITESITCQDQIAAILLKTFPENNALRLIVQSQSLDFHNLGMGTAARSIVRFLSEAQLETLLEHAITNDECFVGIQSEAIYVLGHRDSERAVDLAISALTTSNHGNGKLCRMIAFLVPNEASLLLLTCLAKNFSFELGHTVGLTLRQMGTVLVAQTIDSFANSSNSKDRRAAVFAAAWVIGTEKVIERLLDDLDRDVAATAKCAFEAQGALKLAQHFADQIRAGNPERARLLEGYLQFVDPPASFIDNDPLQIDWEATGFSKAQQIAIEERLEHKSKKKIEYEKLSSFFYWS